MTSIHLNYSTRPDIPDIPDTGCVGLSSNMTDPLLNFNP
jgi:hypothetical protein